MPDPSASTPWRRSEVALAAGRGALAGALVWNVFEVATRKLILAGAGEWAIQWIPPLLMLAAGSPRVLAWVRARNGGASAGATPVAADQRLYLGVLSGRALATLAVVAVLLLLSRGREDWVWDSVADDAGYLLIAAAVTWAWTRGARPGQLWRSAAIAGALAGAAWEAITLKYFSTQISTVLDQVGVTAGVLTFRNLLPGALTWAALGIAGAMAIERRVAATASLPARMAVALGLAAFAVQLLEVVTKLGTIYIGGQVDVASAAAGVVSGPELFSLAFMAVGWALGAASAPGAATLLQSSTATPPHQAAPAQNVQAAGD